MTTIDSITAQRPGEDARHWLRRLLWFQVFCDRQRAHMYRHSAAFRRLAKPQDLPALDKLADVVDRQADEHEAQLMALEAMDPAPNRLS